MKAELPPLHYFLEPFGSKQEEQESHFLTEANLKMIRNKLSTLMAEVAEITFQDGKEMEYVNRMSYLRGQILAYKELFEEHYVAVANNSSYSTQGPLDPITNLSQI